MAYYLDLFDGDPSDGGSSILLAITGSATRVNVTDDVSGGYPGYALVNTDTIVVTESALVGANVSYVGLYDQASGGALKFLHRIGAHYTIAKTNLVQFLALNLEFSGSQYIRLETTGGYILLEDGVSFILLQNA